MTIPNTLEKPSADAKRQQRPVDELKLTVTEARTEDVDRGIVRIDPDDMKVLNVSIGDVVSVIGTIDQRVMTFTHARIMPLFPDDRGKSAIQMDGIQRANAGTALDETVLVRKVTSRIAETVTLNATGDLDQRMSGKQQAALQRSLQDMPLTAGDKIRLAMVGGTSRTFEIKSTKPRGAVLVGDATVIKVEGGKSAPAGDAGGITYEDIGGLKRELVRIREMIELPLRHPSVFQHLGIDAPKGVLLTGPPGSGKTLIARAVAHETHAYFQHVNGPEIVDKFYGASEAQLREIFERARVNAPAIIFIDELDAIAPKREDLGGDRQVERRIVAQLLTLMDGLQGRGDVVVIGATNLANMLDPALRRPGRFDRELTIDVPDRFDRQEILSVHCRHIPLGEDVSLSALAGMTHGYVGADLAAFAREAGMCALRRFLPAGEGSGDLDLSDIDTLQVTTEDFRSALSEIAPSAIREVFSEVPDVRWTDIGGLSREKQTLIEAVEWPLQHEDLYKQAGLRPPKGILLHGAPGTGKTMLAKALANEAEVNFISIKGPQLLSMYVGESERGLRDIFRKARMAAPCIVFFDEIDSIVPVRGSGADSAASTERMVAQFLSEMDGVEELRGVLILAATNRLDKIDPALLRPGRFDLILELPVPDASARQAILELHNETRPLDKVNVKRIVDETEGWTGADLEDLCRRASLAAVRQHLASKKSDSKTFKIRQAHFDEAYTEKSEEWRHARS